MNEEVRKFVEYIREHSETNAVSFELFINAEEHRISWKYRTAKDLKRDGISMCNLAGKFIKD